MRKPTKQESIEARSRLQRLAKLEPELSPIQLAAMLRMSHVTARKYLRELGLYVPRGCAAERKAVST